MSWQDFLKDLVPATTGTARTALASRFSSITSDRASLGRAVGGAERNEPLHDVVSYKEAFSPRLVREVLDHLGVTEGSLLDPFAGAGTSLLVASERRMRAVGVDLLPYAAFASNTLLWAPTADWCKVQSYLSSLETAAPVNVGSFPDFPVRDWAFGPAALAALTRLHRAILDLPPGVERDVLRLSLLCVVEESSQATKDGTSLRRRPPADGRRGRFKALTTRKQVLTAFHDRLDRIKTGSSNRQRPPANSKALVGDARDLPSLLADEKDFDVAVFSPPYPNRYDYTANYQLELGFGFIRDRAELKALRKQQLRSHLEAPWADARTVTSEALNEFLAAVVDAKRPGDQTGRVFRMVAGYFEDMATVLSGIASTVVSGGHVAIVIGTQVFAGQELPTDLILAEIAETNGFVVKDLWIARTKGVAVQQRARFDVVPASRESVLLLQT